MRTDEVVALLLDPPSISELTGREAVVSRLRIKPGVSVVAALADARTGATDGWARVLWPASRAKTEKAEERAVRRGQRYRLRSLGGDLVLESGEVWADPVLAGALRGAARAGVLGVDDPVLRYNPARRLVVRRAATTVRVADGVDPAALALDRALVAAGVPVPGRIDDGSRRGVRIQRFVGDTDLEQAPDAAGTRAAGVALALLHAAVGAVPVEVAGVVAARQPDLAAQGRAHAGILAPLDAGLASRMVALTGRVVGAWAPVAASSARVGRGGALLHGDFTPDQVLLERQTGRVWLTDLDRATLGAPAADLGSYLASAAPGPGEALLDGYRAGGGRIPGDAELRAGRARAVLLGAVDPLRRADPGWRRGVAGRLDILEDLV